MIAKHATITTKHKNKTKANDRTFFHCVVGVCGAAPRWAPSIKIKKKWIYLIRLMLVKINENIFGQPPPLPPFANLSIRASPHPLRAPFRCPCPVYCCCCCCCRGAIPMKCRRKVLSQVSYEICCSLKTNYKTKFEFLWNCFQLAFFCVVVLSVVFLCSR